MGVALVRQLAWDLLVKLGLITAAGAPASQPLDADLTAIAALETTEFGRGFLSQISAAFARGYIDAQQQTTNLDQFSALTANKGQIVVGLPGTWGTVETQVADDGSDLIVKSSALSGVAVRPNKATSSSPTANDDIGDGYEVGSRWINTTTDDVYLCVDNSLGAAVWVRAITDAEVTPYALTLLAAEDEAEFQASAGISGGSELAFGNATLDAIIDDLLNWFPVDEGEGLEAKCLVTTDRLRASAPGTLAWSTALPNSAGLTFDGTRFLSGQASDVPGADASLYRFPSNDANAEWSVNFWLRATDATPSGTVTLFSFFALGAIGTHVYVGVDTSGKLFVSLNTNLVGADPGAMSDNTTYMITLVKKVVAGTPTWFLYRDAVEVDNDTTYADLGVLQSRPMMQVGSGYGGTVKSGTTIAHFSIWTKSLTTNEISALYNSGTGRWPSAA